jgi:hypothetical protein
LRRRVDLQLAKVRIGGLTIVEPENGGDDSREIIGDVDLSLTAAKPLVVFGGVHLQVDAERLLHVAGSSAEDHRPCRQVDRVDAEVMPRGKRFDLRDVFLVGAMARGVLFARHLLAGGMRGHVDVFFRP